jgi:hypothetical protein
MGDRAEDRFLEHILGMKQGLIPGGAVGRAVLDVGEGHRETTLRLGSEEGGVNVRHLTSRLVVLAEAGTQSLPLARTGGQRSEHG